MRIADYVVGNTFRGYLAECRHKETMLTQLSTKLTVLVVLVSILTACNMSDNTDKSSNNLAPIPTNAVINTQPILIITSTPLPTASVQPTPTTAPRAASPQVVSQPCTIPASWIPYRVAVGDTLSSIAYRAGTTSDQLTRGNCLSNPNDIDAGQLIFTPAVVATTTPYATLACTLAPRLAVGGQGGVTPGSPNSLRSLPGRSSASVVIGEIPGGGVFNIISGPQCADGYYWWQVNYNGVIGWTAEGQDSTYWIEPMTTNNCSLTPRLSIGSQGRVITTTPSTLLNQPGSGSSFIGQIPNAGVFTVLAGPQCTENNYWWQVNYNGVIGWTVEGQNMTYWIEPVTTTNCSLTPRLSIGSQGRVITTTPSTLLNQPGSGSSFIGQIPSAGVFTVLAGPQCTENSYWWQVNYNGVIGWTVEGQNMTYWIEPVTTTN
jgi:LysM repeat protein